MDKLITTFNDQPVTSSRQVAESFGKEHKNVLAAVREILVAENQATKFFYEAEHEYRGRKFPMYYMNRDGFSLLVMGFTGEQALEWKIKYINAFNAMEEELAKPKLAPVPAPHYISTTLREMERTKVSLQKMFKLGDGMAYAKAMDLIEKSYGVSLEPIKDLIPATEQPIAYLTPTEIGAMVGKSAREVNLLLAGYGFQHKEGKVWRLDDAGRKYGEEVPYTNNGHSGYQIKWNESVIEHIPSQETAEKCKKKLIDFEIASKISKLSSRELDWLIDVAMPLAYEILQKEGKEKNPDGIWGIINDTVQLAKRCRRKA